MNVELLLHLAIYIVIDAGMITDIGRCSSLVMWLKNMRCRRYVIELSELVVLQIVFENYALLLDQPSGGGIGCHQLQCMLTKPAANPIYGMSTMQILNGVVKEDKTVIR